VSATTDQPSSPEQWVSIQEAAQRLGLSVLTLRRRIKAGTLTAELQVGRRGHEYRVRYSLISSLLLINRAVRLLMVMITMQH
jgi:excisionase family DNA binding protein